MNARDLNDVSTGWPMMAGGRLSSSIASDRYSVDQPDGLGWKTVN